MKQLLLLLLAFGLLAPALADERKNANEPTDAFAEAAVVQHRPLFSVLRVEKALQIARSERKTVLLYFTADWCGPCKILETRTFTDVKVQTFLTGETISMKLNVDDQKKLAQQYKITAIPCCLFVNGAGNEMGRVLGYRDSNRFLEEASKFVR